jgi:hypothetical protein
MRDAESGSVVLPVMLVGGTVVAPAGVVPAAAVLPSVGAVAIAVPHQYRGGALAELRRRVASVTQKLASGGPGERRPWQAAALASDSGPGERRPWQVAAGLRAAAGLASGGGGPGARQRAWRAAAGLARAVGPGAVGLARAVGPGAVGLACAVGPGAVGPGAAGPGAVGLAAVGLARAVGLEFPATARSAAVRPRAGPKACVKAGFFARAWLTANASATSPPQPRGSLPADLQPDGLGPADLLPADLQRALSLGVQRNSIGRPPRHHLLPQEELPFFQQRGFPGRDIDNFTVELDTTDHEIVHGGNQSLARRHWQEHEWNTRLMERLREQEALKKATYGDSPKNNLTREEIVSTMEEERVNFGIDRRPYVNYSAP